ncbi:hypothetical protein V2J09_015269 [Rumex salicifolius]
MEVAGSGGGIGHDTAHWWWAMGSAVQLGLGIRATRRGCNGRLMPLKALGVASLFVGAIAAAAMGTIRACVNVFVRIGSCYGTGLLFGLKIGNWK